MQIVCSSAGTVEIGKPNMGLKQLKEAGFQAVMLDFNEVCRVFGKKELDKCKRDGKTPREYEYYRHPEKISEYVRTCFTKSKELGMRTDIARLPYIMEDGQEYCTEDLYPLLRESMKACALNGVRTVILSPLVAELEDNICFYRKILPWAKENALQVLLTNRCKWHGGHFLRGTCSDAREAAKLIGRLNEEAGEERFGFCVDMGTCSICGQNMYEYMKPLGSLVKAVLVNENNGEKPGALLPFSSVQSGQDRTDWLSFIRGLRAIEFDGMMILDIHDSCRAVAPTLLKPALLQYAARIGEYLHMQISLEQVIARYPQRVLFGAGNMCRNYLKCYGEKYPPLFTCDNNAAIWETEFEGLTIKNPECLRDLDPDCAIFICNIYYEEIRTQLETMGIKNPIHYFNDEYMPSLYLDRFDADTRQIKN